MKYVLLAILIGLVIYSHSLFEKKGLSCCNRMTINYQKNVFAWVTVYHPNIKECGSDKNITTSGLKGQLGMCAVSQKLFDYNINMFDTVCVLSGSLKGKYIVTDKAGSKGKLIDIWKPIGDKTKGCYKTKITVI